MKKGNVLLKRVLSLLLLGVVLCSIVLPVSASYEENWFAPGGGYRRRVGYGKVDVPGVIETATYKTKPTSIGSGNLFAIYGFPAEFPVQKVEVGVKLNMYDLRGWNTSRLVLENGVLVNDKVNPDWKKITKVPTNEVDVVMEYKIYDESSYFQFNQPGYYAFTGITQMPVAVDDPNLAAEYNTVFLHVVEKADTSKTKETDTTTKKTSEKVVTKAEETPTSTKIPSDKTTTTNKTENTQSAATEIKKETQIAPKNTATPEEKTVDDRPIETVYTVKAGDTLATISLNQYGSYAYWKDIQASNKDSLSKTKDGVIYAGMTLVLPDTIGKGLLAPVEPQAGEVLYTVQAGDTLGTIAQAHFGNANRYEELLKRNSDRIKDVTALYEGQILVLPVK